MSRKSLSVIIFLLILALAVVIMTSEGGVSGVMERIGGFISRWSGF
jgi:hypothetical protein